MLVADIIATVIIYLGSYSYRNSSIYDPYWSVVPPLILLFWIFNIETINMLNLYFLAFSVLFWGIRLTYNWARGWEGLKQEDWRYLDLRKKTGRYYQLVNFFGIHLFPTIIVFLCCLPFVGDPIAVSLGFFKVNVLKVSIWMFIGKLVKYIIWAVITVWGISIF